MVGEKSLKKLCCCKLYYVNAWKNLPKSCCSSSDKKKLRNIFQFCNILKDFSLLSPGYVFYCFWFSKKSLSSSSILADLLIYFYLNYHSCMCSDVRNNHYCTSWYRIKVCIQLMKTALLQEINYIYYYQNTTYVN